MNTRISLLAVASSALLLASTSCEKKEPAAAPAPPPAQNASQPPAASPVSQAVDTAQGQTQVVKQKAADAAAAAQSQADAASSKAQGLIDQARKYLGENKWSEALALLNQLTGQKLTSEQQSLVQSLKDQVQKAAETATKAKATEEATKAVGGLIPPK